MWKNVLWRKAVSSVIKISLSLTQHSNILLFKKNMLLHEKNVIHRTYTERILFKNSDFFLFMLRKIC